MGDPGEIKSKILFIHHNLYNMGVQPIPHLFDPGHESGHLEVIVNKERTDRLINEISVYEGLVSLNIDNDFRSEFSGNLCHPVCSGEVGGVVMMAFPPKVFTASKIL